MAVFTLTNVGILVDATSAAGNVNKIDGPNVQVEMVDFTTFASGGWKTKKPGFASYDWNIEGFQDFALGSIDNTVGFSNVGAGDTFTIFPTGGTTVGDLAYFGSAFESQYTALTGAAGQAAAFKATWTGSGKVVEGQVMHPSAARTATGTGTPLAYTAPIAGQSLYAAFHVLSVTGTGTITFTVKTAATIAMTGATTRITSSAFAATGAEIDTVAGPITDGFARVDWTIAGFTSVTFAASIGTYNT